MRARTGGLLARLARRPGGDSRPGDAEGGAEQAIRRLARLEQVVSVPLAGQPLDAVLPEMALRLKRALDADFAAVLLTHGDVLVVRAMAGTSDQGDVGTVVQLGTGLVGRVAQDGGTRTLADVSGAPLALPVIDRELPAAAAAAMLAHGSVIGVVVVGSRAPTRYDESALSLLELAAERLSGAVESARLSDEGRRATLAVEHAQRHLRLLGDASRFLMQSVDDYEAPLVEIMDNAVGQFATFAAVYLAGGEDAGTQDIRLLAARLHGSRRQVTLPKPALAPIREAMADGRSRLVIFNEPQEAEERDRPLAEALAPLGVHSYVVSPIQVRGLSFGALLFGTGPGMRGYRPSDRLAADELSQRIALAAEASLLYREARANAAVTSGHMLRLRALLDVWLDVAAARERADILQAAATGAARLLAPAHVTVLSDGEQYVAPPTSRTARLSPAFLALLDKRAGLVGSDDVGAGELDQADREGLGRRWLAAPMERADGARSWVVAGSNEGVFTSEDESLLLLLTQMVVAMLANAELYQDSRTAASRLAALFEVSPVGMVSLTTELEPHNWNPSAARLFDWPVRPDGPAALPDEVVACVEELSRTSAAGGQRECELVRDGRTHTLVLMLSAVSRDRSVEGERILVVTDETERRQLAAQIQQAQRLEAVGRLSGGIAHDFNNLLTVILGYADGLLRRMDEHEPHRERVEAIHRAGTRGADLTRQLLTISRQQVTNPVVLRPAQVVDEFGTMLRQILGESIDLERVPGGEDLKVRVDRPQFEQVLLNVASNARDAMPEGGRLTIAVAALTGEEAGMPPAEPDGPAWVAVSTTDTGTGMSAETLTHCLEPLFTTKKPGAGTGLGLATAHGIAAQHHGDLRVESHLDRGTTVTLLLPAASGEAATSEGEVLPSPRDRTEVGAGRILLVDDDPDVLRMVERTLRERGFRVRAAPSAARALELLVDDPDPLDLLITDVAMPGMSGAVLARIVQAAGSVPVLFISGYAAQLGDDAELGELLPKPFTPDELVARVTGAISRHPDHRRQDSKR